LGACLWGTMKHQNASTPTVRSSRFSRARALLAATALGAVVALNSGCVAVVAAAGAGAGVAWVRGAVETNLEGDVEKVYRASLKAIADLQLAKVSEQASAIDAKIVARTALDKRVEIKLEKAGNGTKISIRVGLVGDQSLSLSILDRIKSHL